MNSCNNQLVNGTYRQPIHGLKLPNQPRLCDAIIGPDGVKIEFKVKDKRYQVSPSELRAQIAIAEQRFHELTAN